MTRIDTAQKCFRKFFYPLGKDIDPLRCRAAIFLCSALLVVFAGSVQAQSNIEEGPGKEDALLSKNTDGSTEGSMDGPMIIDVLDLRNMDIIDVLKLISQKSGLNIVAGQNVQGKVTVFLKNVEVHEALKILVEANGWAYVQEEQIIHIMTDKEYEMKFGRRFGQILITRIIPLSFAKTANIVTVLNQMKSASGKVVADQNSGTLILTEEAHTLDMMEEVIRRIDVPVTTKVIVLNHAKPEDVSQKISEMLTPALGNIKFDDRTSRIIISDTAEKITAIEKVIEAFDQRAREVLIEAKIIQVTLSDEQKLGVDWEAMVNDYHSLHLMGNFDILNAADKSGKLSIGTLASDDYTVLVEALEEVGHTEILSSPRIMAVHNEEARILVGSTEPYVTTTVTTPASGPTTTAESVTFVEVGVKLYVTPTIHEDDFITMKIKPEVSSVTSNLTTSNNNTIPIIETSEAETTVIVKDKAAIVIGGLIKDEKITITKKVPLLGDIPLLGLAFRSKSDLTRKTEIVIFLTPRITAGDAADHQ
jgi:MSHA type pilus biogenesis protein MshL